ncbi:kelch-like protein 12 isoform X2 [Limulus polyphemus]|nr:kelch-like protein 12 isoform X2 [Limulus polyphemus]XP_022242589.1 kelch-like protein 12 isoform X2 [Limulus polyphemus]XP_022242590.1 kelch-like protein 12 isoform X2 [Limulus polyphemus]XP_022242591.1 kelch-like protein 12 isoform X2 [Limulus polyphemus]
MDMFSVDCYGVGLDMSEYSSDCDFDYISESYDIKSLEEDYSYFQNFDIHSSSSYESDKQHHLEKVFNELDIQRQTGEFCDAEILVSDKRFPVHRNILAAAAPYFQAMFSSGFAEKDQKQVEIKGVEPDTFEKLLSYTYGGSLDVNRDTVEELLHVSDMFAVQGLISACEKYLKNHWRRENFFEYYSLAVKYNLEELKKSILFHIKSNFMIAVTNEYFVACSYELLLSVVQDEDLKVKSEMDILKAVLKWIAHDTCRRISLLESFLNHVKLARITNRNIKQLVDQSTFTKDEKLFVTEKIETRISEKSVLKELGLSLFVLHVDSFDHNIIITAFDASSGGWFNLQSTLSLNQLDDAILFEKDIYIFSEGRNVAYSLEHQEWKNKAPLPTQKHDINACLLNGKLYVIGGTITNKNRGAFYPCQRSGQKSVRPIQVYNPTMDEWYTIGDCFYGNANMPVVGVDDSLYMVCHRQFKNQSHVNILRYNLLNGRFCRLPDSPKKILDAVLLVLDNYIYVFGEEKQTHYRHFWDFADEFMTHNESCCGQRYNITTDTWSVCNIALPQGVKIVTAIALKTSLAVLCQCRSNRGQQLTLYLYDPASDKMELFGEIPFPDGGGCDQRTFSCHNSYYLQSIKFLMSTDKELTDIASHGKSVSSSNQTVVSQNKNLLDIKQEKLEQSVYVSNLVAFGDLIDAQAQVPNPGQREAHGTICYHVNTVQKFVPGNYIASVESLTSTMCDVPFVIFHYESVKAARILEKICQIQDLGSEYFHPKEENIVSRYDWCHWRNWRLIDNEDITKRLEIKVEDEDVQLSDTLTDSYISDDSDEEENSKDDKRYSSYNSSRKLKSKQTITVSSSDIIYFVPVENSNDIPSLVNKKDFNSKILHALQEGVESAKGFAANVSRTKFNIPGDWNYGALCQDKKSQRYFALVLYFSLTDDEKENASSFYNTIKLSDCHLIFDMEVMT